MSATDHKMLNFTPAPDPTLALDSAEPQPAEDADAAPHPGTVSSAAPTMGEGGGTLLRTRRCWLCKVRPPAVYHRRRVAHESQAEYREVHHFYDQFCPSCADFNFEKRGQMVGALGRRRDAAAPADDVAG